LWVALFDAGMITIGYIIGLPKTWVIAKKEKRRGGKDLIRFRIKGNLGLVFDWEG